MRASRTGRRRRGEARRGVSSDSGDSCERGRVKSELLPRQPKGGGGGGGGGGRVL